MRLLPIAQKLAEAANTSIVFDESRCLHDMDRFSDCQDCFDICPAGAIEPGQTPTLDIDACQYCRACLPVCQMGAYTYTGIDAARALVDCVRLMGAHRFELFCQLNPNLDKGDAEVEAAIRVRGCLAGLGAGAYLSLVSQGVEKVVVRTDECENCAWQMLAPRVETQIKQAQALLKLWGRDSAIVIADTVAGDEVVNRPVWKAESPPLSRRSLAQLAAREAGDNQGHEPATGRFRERLRILRAVNKLSPLKIDAQAATEQGVLKDLGFSRVIVSEDCTACGTCARVCPTEALTYTDTGSEFELAFTPQLCISCDFCDHVCAPKAISFDRGPGFEDVFGRDVDEIVQQGELSHCPKCKAPFASRSGAKLCPPCDFRHKNPFGAMTPPGARIGKKA